MKYQYTLILQDLARSVLFCWDLQKKKGSEARCTLLEEKAASLSLASVN
jgi:hypothetical protein